MNDFSFIRLEPTLDKGRNTRPSPVSNIFYLSQIQLSTKEFYCQITNTKDGIAFDGNYEVFVTDCNGTELLDITTKLRITEFTYNGIEQIKYEIAPIGTDFFKRNVLLKFVHTVSDYVWYSNPIIISDYEIYKTSLFEYRDYTGIDAVANVMQSIRLACWFDTNDAEGETSEYVRLNGVKVSGRLIRTELENYKFEKIDNFTFRRLNYLLSNPIVYVNGNRATNKQTLKSSERIGSTNIWLQEFTLPIDYNDTYTSTPQLFEPLELVTFYPSGDFTADGILDEISLDFNRNITLQSGGDIKLFKNGLLIATYTVIDVINNNASVTTLPLTNGEYRVEVSENAFLSEFNELSSFIFWTFNVLNGEYSNTDYNTEFLIN